jgi:hypothetical protein
MESGELPAAEQQGVAKRARPAWGGGGEAVKTMQSRPPPHQPRMQQQAPPPQQHQQRVQQKQQRAPPPQQPQMQHQQQPCTAPAPRVVPKGAVSALVRLQLLEIALQSAVFEAKVEYDSAAVALQHVGDDVQKEAAASS